MNNNFRSSNSGNRNNSYKAFGSTPMSSNGGSYKGFGSSNNAPRQNSSFGGTNSFGRTQSSSMNRPNPFGSTTPRSNGSFGSNNRPSFGSNNRPSFGSRSGSSSGYGLMNSSFSNRPTSMNRPVSVYGKSTGFYFPKDNRRVTTTYRQNDSITFNQNSQILTAPEVQQEYYEDQYAQQTYPEQPVYEEQYQEQVYEEPDVYDTDGDGVADAALYDTDGDGVADTAIYEDGNGLEISDSPYAILNVTIQEQAAQSNSSVPRGAVLADRSGAIYGQAFNFVDETGNEFDAEQYFLADYAAGGAAGLVLYSNAAPNTDATLDLIIDSGIEELIIICDDVKTAKKAKKTKEFKRADKTLSKSGINVDAVSLN